MPVGCSYHIKHFVGHQDCKHHFAHGPPGRDATSKLIHTHCQWIHLLRSNGAGQQYMYMRTILLYIQPDLSIAPLSTVGWPCRLKLTCQVRSLSCDPTVGAVQLPPRPLAVIVRFGAARSLHDPLLTGPGRDWPEVMLWPLVTWDQDVTWGQTGTSDDLRSNCDLWWPEVKL